MKEMAFDAVMVEPSQPADACVFWLHGLGADGYDFCDVVPMLGLPHDHRIRFIFPHAPPMPVTLNAGMIMPAWYDIVAIDLAARQDATGIRKSAIILHGMVDAAIRQGIAANRIILMGFSQGGALALHAALRYEQPLAGVGVLSSYLPLHDTVEKERSAANQGISIFVAHGLMDTVVPYQLAERSLSVLQKLGYAPAWHTYPVAHTVCLPELLDIGKWIQGVLALP